MCSNFKEKTTIRRILNMSFHKYEIIYVKCTKYYYVKITTKTYSSTPTTIPCDSFTDGKRIIMEHCKNIYGEQRVTN